MEEAGSGTSVNLPVVGIGASAGGLEAFQKLLDALPADTGMAFVLVQHLDPNHESMMVDLLAKHTRMPVQHAADGMRLEADSVYIIPPAAYLSVEDGTLRVSEPREQRGARMPFDYLLRSLADALGERAACVVLSGTGADGSVGLKAIKEKCGLVIAQDPDEAGFEGMPQSAVMTGAVDLVLPVAKIPDALVRYYRRMAPHGEAETAYQEADDRLSEIIELLFEQTGHDFSLYKPGTLQRRIERRMVLAAVEGGDVDRYLEILKSDPRELDRLVKELLINVTSFFRDPEVFEHLAETVVPEMVRAHARANPLRIWCVGCSTGEEAYSLAMLFLEQIEATGKAINLQIFASDVDTDAVARAREGLYPEAIAADVTPERLDRFFTKDDQGYRVSAELRSAVVFTVQDLLADPPFSRMDLIACRNLLIYLQPEAQEKAVSLFHFALREDGLLLLGNSESVPAGDDRFEALTKSQRLYRHIAKSRPGDLGFSLGTGESVRSPVRETATKQSARKDSPKDLCRRLVAETHGPAAALINHNYECLYTTGPTDRYLRVVSGEPTNDIFAMARDDVRTKLWSAVQQAIKKNEHVVVSGGPAVQDGERPPFDIEVRPVTNDGENLLFICFLEKPRRESGEVGAVPPEDISRVAQLEEELAATRAELTDALREVEDQAQAQKEINEEALSVNEEYQATNEELETSKEELQSLNEELTALNSQLQETLERERRAANDLQNVLYSTDVATLFLDSDFNIRFFTPATTTLFNIIPGDIGRPISDLQSRAADEALLQDVRAVLDSADHAPLAREIETTEGAWYIRRILPYRTESGQIDGVVITFTDITEQRRTAEALDAAKRDAEQANIAKSRFLAAASHDLRQPLQTLALLQGILAKTVEGEREQQNIARLGELSNAMSGMLNALLDLNQIEAGTVTPEKQRFCIGDVLERLGDEFAYFAQSKGVDLKVVASDEPVYSDPRLLEQMIRNLLSNAFKYTESGKVLLGCRRRGDILSIEIWDTGIGISEDVQETIFDEYYQVNNPARERSRGLGLGLSIVSRFAELLGHRLHARSELGKGSVFTIELPRSPQPEVSAPIASVSDMPPAHGAEAAPETRPQHAGTVLVVEDDPDLRDALALTLEGEGHHVATASDATHALELIAGAAVRPDLIVADYNLPQEMTGLALIETLRERQSGPLPAIVLTGDMTTSVLREIAQANCTYIGKPVKPATLGRHVGELLSPASSHADAVGPNGDGCTSDGADSAPIVYAIDDDAQVLEELRTVLEDDGLTVEVFPTAEAFLEAYCSGREACLLVDARLPGLDGLELLERLRGTDPLLTTIVITGKGDVGMAVQAMHAGASDFIEKPVGGADLIEHVRHALERSRNATKHLAWQEEAAKCLAKLTLRQREIMDLILAGHPNKNIAADLGISQRTVENHRATIMKKTGVTSLPALARLAITADRSESAGPA